MHPPFMSWRMTIINAVTVLLLLLLLLQTDVTMAKPDSLDASAGTTNDGKKENTAKLLVKFKQPTSNSNNNNDNNNNLRSFATRSNNNGGGGVTNQLVSNKIRSVSNISEKGHLALVDVSDEDKEMVIHELMNDDNVLLVEEDFEMYKSPAIKEQQQQQQHSAGNLRRSLEEEVQQYGNRLIQADEIWSTVSSQPNRYINTPVKVCIIDTGYNIDHEDLPKTGVTQTDVGYGSSFLDKDGHGTHCAGVIGAIGGNQRGVVGVNPDATKFSFHIVKALNDEGVGTASAVLRAIQGCIDNGSKIISMSIGGGPNSEIFRDEYERAYNEGVLLVSASGNQGKSIHDYPASYATVISVGGVDRYGNRADFSNYSDQLELMGPGVSIKSTYADGYRSLSGTSMATPFVAGAFALVWGYFPNCSNHQMRNVFARTARRISQDPSGCDEKNGYGIIQTKAAFDALVQFGCEYGGEDSIPKSLGAVGGCQQTRSLTAKTRPPTERPTEKPTSPPLSLHMFTNPTEQPTSTSASPPTNPFTIPFITWPPTKTPTFAMPTVSQTSNPTSIPSDSPTNLPKHPPTSLPTTPPPTSSPTNGVSLLVLTTPPTSLPPTNRPSSTPTTAEPTNVPTSLPPSAAPTKHPSRSPTNIPTSSSPTSSPLASPSKAPTPEPSTAAPTPSPMTSEPSSVPSAKPTTDIPTTTEPSFLPSAKPTTDSPTTSEPSFSPSAKPTTDSPTTSEPSVRPSLSPRQNIITPSPSSSPAIGPTTTEPSVKPTQQTMMPSVFPSSNPTAAPSTSPTDTATSKPSGSPSMAPSRYPTPLPITAPSKGPTLFPTPLQLATSSPTGNLGDRASDEPAICLQLEYEIQTDEYADETSWVVKQEPSGEVIGSGPPAKTSYDENSLYRGNATEDCLGPGTYTFVISDVIGDGISSPGYYKILLDGVVLASNSDFGKEEITNFTVGTDSLVPEIRSGWKTLVAEGFHDKFGKRFSPGGNNVRWTSERFGRLGLVMMHSGRDTPIKSSLVSEKIILDAPYKEVKLVISFYANGHMTGDGDGFCFDYASNLASGWTEAKCWRTGQDFETEQWYDQERIRFSFDTDDALDFIQIRFRSDSDDSMDRIFLDKVDLLVK